MLIFKGIANFARKAKPISAKTQKLIDEQKQISNKMQKMEELNKYIHPDLSAQFDKYIDSLKSPTIEGTLKKIQEDLESEHCQFSKIQMKTQKNGQKQVLRSKNSDFTKNLNKMLNNLMDDQDDEKQQKNTKQTN